MHNRPNTDKVDDVIAATDGNADITIPPTISHEVKTQAAIAVIGMACRLPSSIHSPQQLWELCSRSRCAWSEIPKHRFNAERFYHPNATKLGTFNNKGAHFLTEDIALFDAPFFNLTAAEATSMDPQQRLALECTYEALESAGISKEFIAGQSVGVFAGGSYSDYEMHNVRDLVTAPAFNSTGTAACMLSNRVSYHFDCRGPSCTTDTACSSSLTSMHLACQSLLRGECDMAIVIGSHLNLLPDLFVTMSTSKLFNDEGKSYPFDHRAKGGFARGEGCGVVILKLLDRARSDDDPVRALIANTGINQDGKTAGITTPSGASQEALINEVYTSANLSFDEVAFVEAHGTGTKVGDPIEARTLHNTIGKNRSSTTPLYIGSLKSNIGHLEGASGVVSTIKAVMMLERGLLLPNIHFEKPNPAIPMKEWNMKVPTTVRPWPRKKKYISVSNYGFGGANAHAVLQKAPVKETPTINGNADHALPDDTVHKLFVVSAESKISLEQRAKDLSFYLEQRPDAFEKYLPGNLAYTLGQRRSHLTWRYAVCATSSDDLGVRLNSGKLEAQRRIQDPRLAFICTGQGAQWASMGCELMDAYDIFRDCMHRADNHLKSLGATFTLSEEIMKAKESSRIDDPEIAQPACSAIQCALIDLLRSWNVLPSVVVGHSSGEIAAAYAAGMLSFESSLALAFLRGRATMTLKQRHPKLKGAMLAVGTSAETIRPMIDAIQGSTLTIACVNSPASVTVSGDDAAVTQLQEELNEQSIFNRRLRVDVAYHSSHMQMVAEDYLANIKDIRPLEYPRARMHSSLHGRLVEVSELQPAYWVANLVSPVEFNQAVQSILETGDAESPVPALWMEIGPHPQLSGPVKEIVRKHGTDASKLSFHSTLVRNANAVESLLNSVGQLYGRGILPDLGKINFPGANPRAPALLIDLPTYPWAHKERYWHHSRINENHLHSQFPRNEILGAVADYSDELEPTWRNLINLDEMPWLRHHKMQDLTVYPMAGYLAMAMQAALQRAAKRDVPCDRFELREVKITRPLVLEDDKDVEIVTKLLPYSEGTASDSDIWDEFRVSSYSAAKGMIEHARGLVAARDGTKANAVNGRQQMRRLKSILGHETEEMWSSSREAVDVADMYSSLHKIGCQYGSSFQGFDNTWACDSYSCTDIVATEYRPDSSIDQDPDLVVHPTFLDIFVQTMWPILGAGRAQGLETLYMPSSIKHLSVLCRAPTKPGSKLRSFAKGSPDFTSPRPTKFDIWAADPDDLSVPLIELEDMTMTPLMDAVSDRSLDARKICYKVEWEPVSHSRDHSSNGHSNGVATNGNGNCHTHDTSGTNGTAKTTNGDSNGAAHAPTEPTTHPDLPGIAIVQHAQQQTELINELSQYITKTTGAQPSVHAFGEGGLEGKLCIVVAELEQPLISNIMEAGFEHLRQLLNSADSVLWVTRGALRSPVSPALSTIVGLARTVRSETSAKIVTLDLDPERQAGSVNNDCDAIIDVIQQAWTSKDKDVVDMEYVEKDGELLIPRLTDDAEINQIVQRETSDVAPYLQPYVQSDRSLKLKIGVPGALDTLHFVDDSSHAEALEADQIEIEIKATGMNFKDVVVSMGQVPQPYIGIESSGVVSQIGSNVSSLRVGDRVMAMTEGAYSTYGRCLGTSACKIPDDMTFESACTIPVVFCTAYYALKDLGRLEEGDTVLIHAAAGGVGQAAMQIAKMIGAEIFATVGSPAKKQFIMRHYGIPESRIFYSRDTSFGPAIRKVTGGRGVDVVLNSLAGDSLRASWDCLAHFGRFVEIGKRDILNNTRLEMAQFEHNASFASVDLSTVATERPRIMKRIFANVSELFKNKTLRPIEPITNYPISELETAFRQVQSGKSMGKLVVTSSKDDQVKATAPKTSAKCLSADATYLLIGGTGGLGRSMAQWMSAHGAGNIALISRSGKLPDSTPADFVKAMNDAGTEIKVMACDVANESSVTNLVAEVTRTMPPIRGIIHGAMVLRDTLFERMTYEDYTAVVNAKVPGAWNFHYALSTQTLDFTIYLSSIAGIVGNRGQAAYAAANVFLDSFAAFQRNLGIPATSIDLTAVTGVGYLAENAAAAAEVTRTLGSEVLHESEVLALLRAAIDGTMLRTCGGQCVTGLHLAPGKTDTFWASDLRFAKLKEAALSAGGGDGDAAVVKPLGQRLREAADEEERVQTTCTALIQKLSAVLMVPQDEIEPSVSVTSLGLDSLVGIEVRNWIVRECEANMQVLEILTSANLTELARAIMRKSQMKFA